MAITADIRDNLFYKQAYALAAQDVELKTLQRLLEHRFGPLSEAVQQRLSSLSAKELEAAIDRVLDAKQLADVFGERQN